MDTSAVDKINKKFEQWREIKKGLESKMMQLEEYVNVTKKGTEVKYVEVIKKDIDVEAEEATIKSLEAGFKELPKPSQGKNVKKIVEYHSTKSR